MSSTRYSIVITNSRTGVVRHLTVSRRALASAVLGAGVLPLLLVTGASYKGSWQRAMLEAEVSALRTETAAMRETAGALTEQMATLHSVVGDLSRLTPDAVERTAMARLPRRVQQEALGGLSPEAARIAMAGPSPAQDAIGVAKQMLSVLRERLNTARPRLERQAALARATPAIWPAIGALTSSFGPRHDPFTLEVSLHPGLDLDVNAGDPVHATAEGTVREAQFHPEYGNVVTVSHGFGIETRYAHLSQLLVRAGTKVTRGQLVGRAGSTGRSTGTHLHYEVWIDGRPVNPRQYLVGRGTR